MQAFVHQWKFQCIPTWFQTNSVWHHSIFQRLFCRHPNIFQANNTVFLFTVCHLSGDGQWKRLMVRSWKSLPYCSSKWEKTWIVIAIFQLCPTQQNLYIQISLPHSTEHNIKVINILAYCTMVWVVVPAACETSCSLSREHPTGCLPPRWSWTQSMYRWVGSGPPLDCHHLHWLLRAMENLCDPAAGKRPPLEIFQRLLITAPKTLQIASPGS